MALRSERGVSRVLKKLEASVNAGQYYEAHQMYRTLYFRYLEQHKYTELLDLLSQGSLHLLQRDQQGSGADLAILLVEALVEADIKPCAEWIEKIVKLFELMSYTIPERDAFLTNAVKWSMDSNKRGHPLLHKRIAEIFWKERKYSVAHKHFLYSNDGATYASMLVELHMTRGLKAEMDLFIAQAVLQFLCLRNLEMAKKTFIEYINQHPVIKTWEGPPFHRKPLLNFLWFIFLAIEQKKTKMFLTLRAWYSDSLKRDPNYSVYLDKIGRLWFGVDVAQPNRNKSTMLGGLLKSIIGDADSSGDEAEAKPSVSAKGPDLD